MPDQSDEFRDVPGLGRIRTPGQLEARYAEGFMLSGGSEAGVIGLDFLADTPDEQTDKEVVARVWMSRPDFAGFVEALKRTLADMEQHGR